VAKIGKSITEQKSQIDTGHIAKESNLTGHIAKESNLTGHIAKKSNLAGHQIVKNIIRE
jgi:hypothetical protein